MPSPKFPQYQDDKDPNHRVNRMSPSKVRTSASPYSFETPARSVIHVRSKPSLKCATGAIRHCITRNPNVACIGAQRVVLQPALGELPPRLRLPNLNEALTNLLTVLAIDCPHGVAPSRSWTMDTFLNIIIGYCGKCAICTRPVDFSTFGIPHAIGKDVLEVEHTTV